MNRTRTLGVLAAIGALALTASPVFGQDESTEMMDMPTVEVAGVEYAFLGLPTSVPAGTEITFRNDGAELHEIFILHIPDETTESVEELMAMGDEAFAAGKWMPLAEMPLIAMPSGAAEGSFVLENEGRHLAVCFIPTGAVPEDIAAAGVDIAELGPETDITTLPEEVQVIMTNPPHFTQGMIQEFTVTAAGTEFGPMPEDAMEDEAA